MTLFPRIVWLRPVFSPIRSLFQIKELCFALLIYAHTYARTHTKRLETLFKRLFSCSLSSFVSYPVCFSYPLINLNPKSLVMLAFCPETFCQRKKIGEFWTIRDFFFICLFLFCFFVYFKTFQDHFGQSLEQFFILHKRCFSRIKYAFIYNEGILMLF